mgnify:CR=1 FL=1
MGSRPRLLELPDFQYVIRSRSFLVCYPERSCVDSGQVARHQPATSFAGGPKCILVADDEPIVRRYVARVLREAGYLVREAADGAEAFELVRLDARLFDAVLSDVVMPRVNGIELLQRLAHIEPGLPVVLMSGFGIEQLAARGISVPCGVLPKPFGPDLLLDEIGRCLRKRT